MGTSMTRALIAGAEALAEMCERAERAIPAVRQVKVARTASHARVLVVTELMLVDLLPLALFPFFFVPGAPAGDLTFFPSFM